MDLHNGLDIEVYDLRPTDLHYYYYYYLLTGGWPLLLSTMPTPVSSQLPFSH